MTKQTPHAGNTTDEANSGKKPAVIPHGVTATNSTEPGLASLNGGADATGTSSGHKGTKP